MTKEFESFHSVARLVSLDRCETVFRECKKNNFTRYARTNTRKLVIELSTVGIKKLEVELALQFTRSFRLMEAHFSKSPTIIIEIVRL